MESPYFHYTRKTDLDCNGLWRLSKSIHNFQRLVHKSTCSNQEMDKDFRSNTFENERTAEINEPHRSNAKTVQRLLKLKLQLGKK